jgi:ADP-ribose pyrophosphatase
MWELPAGAIKGQETPLQAAKRELLEETGYIGDFEIVNPRCFGSVYATHHAVFLVATHCTKIAEQNLDTDEFVDVVLFDMPQFRELLRASDNMNLLLSYQALEHLRLL